MGHPVSPWPGQSVFQSYLPELTNFVVTANNVYQLISNFFSLRFVGEVVKKKKRQMLRTLPEGCWFSKHTSQASVAGNRSHSCCLKPKRIWFKVTEKGSKHLESRVIGCSSQRCFTTLPWCLDPWILAAPSWLTTFFRTGPQYHQVVSPSWYCASAFNRLFYHPEDQLLLGYGEHCKTRESSGATSLTYFFCCKWIRD